MPVSSPLDSTVLGHDQYHSMDRADTGHYLSYHSPGAGTHKISLLTVENVAEIIIFKLGPSALAGFALFLVLIPLQERLMSIQLRIRKEANRWTDQRAKIILEVLGAMRVVKYFSYEVPFLQRQ